MTLAAIVKQLEAADRAAEIEERAAAELRRRDEARAAAQKLLEADRVRLRRRKLKIENRRRQRFAKIQALWTEILDLFTESAREEREYSGEVMTYWEKLRKIQLEPHAGEFCLDQPLRYDGKLLGRDRIDPIKIEKALGQRVTWGKLY